MDIEKHKEQFKYLIDVLCNSTNRNETTSVLEVLLTSSEKVVVSQRLEILRLLNKGFRYDDIEIELRVCPSTISTTIDQFMKAGNSCKHFNKVMTRTKKEKKKTAISAGSDSLLVNRWYKSRKKKR